MEIANGYKLILINKLKENFHNVLYQKGCAPHLHNIIVPLLGTGSARETKRA